MQTTLRLDRRIYQEAKAEAARGGMTMTRFLEEALREKLRKAGTGEARLREMPEFKIPAWFGSLKPYAKKIGGSHDMETIRRSMGQGIGRAKA